MTTGYPAGQLMTRIGYTGGILLGLSLSLYATDALLLFAWPPLGVSVFLGALFVIASGLRSRDIAAIPRCAAAPAANY